jgi:hypothetical protein
VWLDCSNRKDVIAIRVIGAFDGNARCGHRSLRRTTSNVRDTIDEDRALLVE